jgi:Fur family peroxide stress response transcriptional regulator
MPTSRNTNQRLKILGYLQSVHSHPTAEQVYEEVRKELPAISLATVYRNLNFLTDQGRIQRLEINKEYHFDADCCCHQHFVCKECGAILDVHQENMSRNTLKQFRSDGCCPECVCITFTGKCKKCR